MRLVTWSLIFGFLGTCVAWHACAQVPATDSSVKHYALLIGCTKYPNLDKKKELNGPDNDVPTFSKLLETKFGFHRKNIRTLVGWPDDVTARPTLENITAAFNELIAKAEDGSQIVVLMSGHGAQVPDDNGDETDGLDEVFLPADVSKWTENNVPNAIRDDQFGKWFDALRAKGAHVWAVFDCCHSATMTRGTEEGEIMRIAKPEDLGIPDEAFKTKPAQTGAVPQRALDVASQSTRGSLTEYYAAQAFETAPELPRPANATPGPNNSYGLFTYSLVQVLQQRQGALSYADLSREIVNGYRSERGTKPPTPFFAGDLNREVLGLRFWPKRANILIQHEMGKFQIDAGEIHGITPGSILAVTANNPNQAQAETLGYVRVTVVTPTSSIVETCEYEGKPVVAIDKFPKDARCRVVLRDVGDMRVKIALRRSTDTANANQNQTAAKLYETAAAALKKLPDEVQNLVNLTADEANAEWFLHVVTPAEAVKCYQQKVDTPAVMLVKAVQQSGDPGSQTKAWSVYMPDALQADKQVETLSEQLANDLQKIFTWQNIWRVAGHAGSPAESDLKLEITRSSVATPGTALEAPNIFHAGDQFSFAVTNDGTEKWWITVLHLDPHYGIDVWAHDSVKARRSLEITVRINDKSFGPEGVVVLATSFKQNQPNYNSLAQAELGDHKRSRGDKGNPATQFGRLLDGASIGKATRGDAVDAPDRPQVFMRTWLTLPEVKKSK